MGFKIDYTPVGGLVQAAAGAGRAASARTSQAIAARQRAQDEDLRFRLSMAEMTAGQRDQDRVLRGQGMALQEAAGARMAGQRDRTIAIAESAEARRVEAGTPVEQKRELMGFAMEQQQAQQARQMESLEFLQTTGVITKSALEKAKFGVMSGSAGVISGALRSPNAKQASFAQKRQEAEDRADARDLQNKVQMKLSQSDLTPEDRQNLGRQLVAISSEATTRWGTDWLQQPMASNYAKQAVGRAKKRQSYAVPANPALLKKGRLYYDPKTGDMLGTWNGKRWRMDIEVAQE